MRAFFWATFAGDALQIRTLRPMAMVVDLILLAFAAVASPIWLPRMLLRGRHRTDWGARFGRAPALGTPPVRGRVLLHAVSVGEVGAIRGLVEQLNAIPDLEVVVASTTDTGMTRAQDLFGKTNAVVRWPLDLSWSVKCFLRSVQPTVVGLVELEVWPNMTSACERRGIRTIVISGRLSDRSARRYGWIGPLVRPMFRRVTHVAAQDEASAVRFRKLGVPADRVEMAGNMKWDSAGRPLPASEAATQLADDLRVSSDRLLVVGGSTAPGEEALLRSSLPDGPQLICAPRRPEWWDDAAMALSPCARRSQSDRTDVDRVVLDTIGDLSDAYALADIVVVGRSFGSLHGSDPIEPIARGAATVIGPAVDDFRDVVRALKQGGGLVQCTAEELHEVLSRLVENEALRAELVAAGRAVIESAQGATSRCAELLATAARTS